MRRGSTFHTQINRGVLAYFGQPTVLDIFEPGDRWLGLPGLGKLLVLLASFYVLRYF